MKRKKWLLLMISLFVALTPLTSLAEETAAPAVTTLAGTGGHGASDGAQSAEFNLPYAIAGDSKNLYVADTYNNLIRVVDIDTGAVRTYMGRSLGTDDQGFPIGFFRDGAKREALFNRPYGIAVGTGGRLYVADGLNNAIRQVNRSRVTTHSGGAAGHQDGNSDEALYNAPSGIAVDKKNNMYVADTLNHCIRKIDARGKVTTIAGIPGTYGNEDGNAKTKALFNSPMGIAVADNGDIYVADTGNHTIRLIRGNRVDTLAGITVQTDQDGQPLGGFADGAADAAMFSLPVGLALYGDSLLVADSANNRIRSVSVLDGGVTTLAGTGEPGAADGAALQAELSLPSGLFINKTTLYIADTGNNLIRVLDLEVAGNE
jgi:sugar lactone lactonase YvrE